MTTLDPVTTPGRSAEALVRGQRGPMSSAYRWLTVALLALVTIIAFEAMAISTAMPSVAKDLDAVRSYGLAFSLLLTAELLGIAVEMAIASNAMMVTSARSATVSHLYAELIGPRCPRTRASAERPGVVTGSSVVMAPRHQMRPKSEWVHGRAVSQTVVSVGTIPKGVSC